MSADAGSTIRMQCLVCTGDARDLTPENFDGCFIECPSCGKYEVAGGAREKFRNGEETRVLTISTHPLLTLARA